MIGKTISHYRITEKLGEGGMGAVYKAEDAKLKRSVALKFLPKELTRNPEAKKRFIREAQAASFLQHTNICTIHEIDEIESQSQEAEAGQMFICMDYYEGQTLKDLIKDKKINTKEAIAIALQIAQGLSCAHAANEIHRDIKPANIIITKNSEVKIIDFGLARLVGQTKFTKDSLTVGTVDYMSPEQTLGDNIDLRTDIWSFGVVLYEMFYGEPPFKGEYDLAIIYSILNEQPSFSKKPMINIPEEIKYIIQRCLMKNPDDRYSSMKELVHILKPYHQQSNSSTHIYKILPYPGKVKKIQRFFLPGIVIITLFGAWLIWQVFFSIPDEKHIAILPLEIISADKNYNIYRDGLLEIITSRLTQLEKYHESMWVIPSSDIRKYKITSAREAYKKFNANLVITGSIDKRSGYVQMVMNLVQAKNLRQLRSTDLKIYDADISSKMEERIIDKIIDMLDLQLRPKRRANFFVGGTHLKNAYDYYLQGRGYLQRYEDEKNIDTSIRLFKQALQTDSAFTLAWAGLGEAYWRKYEATKDIRFVEPAMETCKRAIRQNDHYADVYVTCGMIKLGIGEYKAAIQVLKKALKVDSLNGVAYWTLGHAYQLLGDSVAALQTYKKAIEKRPGSWQGYSYLGYFYLSNGKYAKALAPYKKVVQLLPHSDLGYNKLAATYFYLDRFAEAVQNGERAVGNEPSYISYSNLASFYYYAGQYKKASLVFHKVFKINNHNYMIAGNLASAYRYSNQADSARYYFHTAIKLAEKERKVNPKNLMMLSALAGYYSELHDSINAFSMLHQVEELNPTQPDILFNIGDTFEQLGKRDSALSWIKRAIESGYTMAKFKNNPGLANLIADKRFEEIWKNAKSAQ